MGGASCHTTWPLSLKIRFFKKQLFSLSGAANGGNSGVKAHLDDDDVGRAHDLWEEPLKEKGAYPL